MLCKGPRKALICTSQIVLKQGESCEFCMGSDGSFEHTVQL